MSQHTPSQQTLNFEDLLRAFLETQALLQGQAQRAINTALVVRNWLFGYYNVEFEQLGEERAEYGSQLLKRLSEQLKQTDVKGASFANLKNWRQFYLSYAPIRQTLFSELPNLMTRSSESQTAHQFHRQIIKPLTEYFKLSWSHYLTLMRIQNADERQFYELEALNRFGKL